MFWEADVPPFRLKSHNYLIEVIINSRRRLIEFRVFQRPFSPQNRQPFLAGED